MSKRVDVQVERVPCGGAMVVRVLGELDRETAAPLRDALSQTLADGIAAIVVNLGQVEYIDSIGLSVIIAGASKAQKAGGKLVVCGLGTHLQKVFEISGAQHMLHIGKDEAEALAALSPSK